MAKKKKVVKKTTAKKKAATKKTGGKTGAKAKTKKAAKKGAKKKSTSKIKRITLFQTSGRKGVNAYVKELNDSGVKTEKIDIFVRKPDSSKREKVTGLARLCGCGPVCVAPIDDDD